jgi:hypothetical protein
MRRTVTIESILIAGLTITFGLLITAALLFYKNHKKLTELRRQAAELEGVKQSNEKEPRGHGILFTSFGDNSFFENWGNESPLHNDAEYRKYAEKENHLFLIFCCFSLITVELAAFGLIYSIKNKNEVVEEDQQFGPPGFFYPLKIKGSLKFFEGKVPQKPPRRHFTNLILDIKQIDRNKKSYIKVVQKLIGNFRNR